MDRKSLEQFVVIAEMENISKAAETLNIAQPHLSRQLKKLEKEIGVELFERKKKRLYLTSAGRHLLKRSQEITRLMDQTIAEIRSVKNSSDGVLRIGSLESATMSFFTEWVARFRRSHPHFVLHMSNCGTTSELLTLLNENLIEAAIVKEPVSTTAYCHIALHPEPWVIIAPRNSQLARHSGEVKPCELDGVPLLLPCNNLQIDDIVQWLRQGGVSAHLAATWTTLTGGIFLMRAGVGVLICTASGVQLIKHDSENFIVRPIQFTEINYKWLLLWNKRMLRTDIMANFIEFVQGQVRNNGNK